MLPHAQSQVKASLGFQFVAMPTDILQRSDLSAPAKLLAAVIMDSARGSASGRCKLTNASLGAKIGRSAVSVKRLLGELEAAGLVRRETIADKHNRAGILPTWVDRIRAAGQASAAQDRPGPGSTSTRPPVQDRPAIQTPVSEPTQTGSSSTLEGTEKKPSPAEVAAGIRAMVAGTYSDAMFGGKDAASSRTPARNPSPAPDVRTMFGRVGFSARAAAYARAPKRSAADQIAELRARSAARGSA